MKGVGELQGQIDGDMAMIPRTGPLEEGLDGGQLDRLAGITCGLREGLRGGLEGLRQARFVFG